MRIIATLALALFALSARALAHATFVSTWQGIYPNSTSDDNVINGTGSACQLCHWNTSGGSSWNAYGWRVRQGIHNGLALSAAISGAAPDNSDFDPIGCANVLEINASTQPGWTAGPNNTQYTTGGQTSGQNPPAAILGALDPSAPLFVYCSPGLGGTQACPCGNAPLAAGLGCNNSDNSGGASIGAAGLPSLGADGIVFTTAGQKASATSVLLQGSASNASGAIFGQGIRCVAGTLKRLYVKPASGGSIQAPAPGDPSVSARSAALGDTLAAGMQREYMVYYRDPFVLGGCPASSTFNATSSGSLVWLP